MKYNLIFHIILLKILHRLFGGHLSYPKTCLVGGKVDNKSTFFYFFTFGWLNTKENQI